MLWCVCMYVCIRWRRYPRETVCLEVRSLCVCLCRKCRCFCRLEVVVVHTPFVSPWSRVPPPPPPQHTNNHHHTTGAIITGKGTRWRPKAGGEGGGGRVALAHGWHQYCLSPPLTLYLLILLLLFLSLPSHSPPTLHCYNSSLSLIQPFT